METNTKSHSGSMVIDDDLAQKFHEEFGDMSGEEVLVALHQAVQD